MVQLRAYPLISWLSRADFPCALSTFTPLIGYLVWPLGSTILISSAASTTSSPKKSESLKRVQFWPIERGTWRANFLNLFFRQKRIIINSWINRNAKPNKVYMTVIEYVKSSWHDFEQTEKSNANTIRYSLPMLCFHNFKFLKQTYGPINLLDIEVLAAPIILSRPSSSVAIVRLSWNRNHKGIKECRFQKISSFLKLFSFCQEGKQLREYSTKRINIVLR